MQIASWSIIAPIAHRPSPIALALVLPGFAAQYVRLADGIAALLTIVVAACAGYAVFEAWSQASQIADVARGVVQTMAGNSAEAQAYANSHGQSVGVSVVPGIGLAMLLAAALAIALAMTLQGVWWRR